MAVYVDTDCDPNAPLQHQAFDSCGLVHLCREPFASPSPAISKKSSRTTAKCEHSSRRSGLVAIPSVPLLKAPSREWTRLQ